MGSPIVDSPNKAPSGQVGLDAEGGARSNGGPQLSEDDPTRGYLDAAERVSLFQELRGNKNRVPLVTSVSLDVVFPAPFGPAKIKASGGDTAEEPTVIASLRVHTSQRASVVY
jgi:hypothetical protein